MSSSSSSSSSSTSPCAACKIQRRKCTQDCVFAPYFPPDQPQKFANVHKVFGASNVTKLLNDLHATQREDAVNSLAYEAEERLRDPVYGCVGLISILQHRLKQLQSDLYSAKKELAAYVGPHAMHPSSYEQQHQMDAPIINVLPSTSNAMQNGMVSIDQNQYTQQQQQQQQIYEAQLALAVAARGPDQMLTRTSYHQTQQQQQQEIVRFTSEFNQKNENNISTRDSMSPSLCLGSFEQTFQVQPEQYHHHQIQAPVLLLDQQRSGSDEEAAAAGPSA